MAEEEENNEDENNKKLKRTDYKGKTENKKNKEQEGKKTKRYERGDTENYEGKKNTFISSPEEIWKKNKKAVRQTNTTFLFVRTTTLTPV
jgi:hypothetical protein